MDDVDDPTGSQTGELVQGDDARCVRFLERAEQIRDAHVIAAVISLGRAALEELFDGSWERALDRSAAQTDSLSSLMSRHAVQLDYLGISLDQIRTALRAYQVDRQLPPKSMGKLLPGALRALSVVPDPEVRTQLANQAVAQHWTVEQTQAEVASWRQGAGLKGKGGRPPLPVALKALRKVARSVETLEDGDFELLDDEGRLMARNELLELRGRVDGWLSGL